MYQFAPMTDQDKKNLPTSPETEFKKTNSAIGLVVAEGKLSFLDRKIFNVAVFHAQRLGALGVGAPVQDATSSQYYWQLYSDVVKDADFGSKDTEYFMQCIENLQSIKVMARTETDWTSERLLGPVRLHKEKGTAGRGGRVWLGFKFDPNVEQQVLNPMPYTRLSLYYQTMLRTGHGLALYEMARKYATSPSHMTFADRWEWWHDYLTGQAISTEPLNIEYKYFKRNIIKPAVDEVNAVTNVTVELREIKEGRRVVSLQFITFMKSQEQLELSPEPVIDSVLIDALRAIGFSEYEAQNISARENPDLVKKTLDLLRARMDKRELTHIDSPMAYFRKLLKDRSAESLSPTALLAAEKFSRNAQKVDDPAQASIELEAVIDPARELAMKAFEALPPPDRTRTLERFSAILQEPLASTYRKQGIGSPLIRKALEKWLLGQAGQAL
jgi:hypothetical protein